MHFSIFEEVGASYQLKRTFAIETVHFQQCSPQAYDQVDQLSVHAKEKLIWMVTTPNAKKTLWKFLFTYIKWVHF